VYKLSDDVALVQTIDFFTPIVDDPFTFGQIAAANALSDVYAMGGTPLTAMNIVCFPQKTMDITILKEVLAGGIDKIHEADVVLVGGHSVEDQELKYGLSVTGIVHPDRVIYNNGAKAGDLLILTKPIGTGIITTAIKGGMADENAIAKVTDSMTMLNRQAAELMQEVGVSACTDITGFGLLGHAVEMMKASNVGMVIQASMVPYFPEARDLANMGMVPGGTYRNRDFYSAVVEIIPKLPDNMVDILFDAQTSGGLLIAVAEPKAKRLLARLHNEGIEQAVIIGEITDAPKGKISVR
jgi:selenide,water dikinase